MVKVLRNDKQFYKEYGWGSKMYTIHKIHN